MSYGDLLDYLEQIPRIRKFEAGEDPDAKLDVTQFIQEVLAGRVKPDAYKPKGSKISPAEKAQLEKQLQDQLGIGSGKKQREVQTRMPAPQLPKIRL